MESVRSVSKLLLAVFLAAGSTASAHIQYADQENLNAEALVAAPSTRFSQSFIPTATSLNVVEVIVFVSGTENVMLELTLFAGNGLSSAGWLRSAERVTVSPADGPIPVEFRFPFPVQVVPDNVYTFSIAGYHASSYASASFSVQYGSDTYERGNMFDSRVHPEHDLYFREGITPIPPSITRVSPQHVQLKGRAIPNSSVPILASSSLSNESFVVLGTAQASDMGWWESTTTSHLK